MEGRRDCVPKIHTHTANLFSIECYFLILQMLNNAAFNIALILMS